jgi:site-specific DNA-methyltransferase (adenine-specific)
MTRFSVVAGDMREVLADMIGESIDACVCDPPYGLSFMCKGWDQQVPGPEYWAQVLHVLKPGAHLLAFGGTRTSHRLASAIEDAGFEIRDCISWAYGQGFPKNHNVSIAMDKQAGAMGHRGKAIVVAGDGGQQDDLVNPQGMAAHVPITEDAKRWEGWGSALKPAIETIYLARKPLVGTLAANVKRYGTGALNIAACRVGDDAVTINRFVDGAKPFGGGAGHEYETSTQLGRWPANLIHDGSDEVVAALPEAPGQQGPALGGERDAVVSCYGKFKRAGRNQGPRDGNPTSMAMKPGQRRATASAARFFKMAGPDEMDSRLIYCPKASKAEREAGLDGFTSTTVSDGRAKAADNAYQRGKTQRLNTHPTVKPIALLRYLARLITPPGGVLLDPFCGSGSQGCAAVLEGFRFLGIDLDPEYVAIAKARIAHAAKLA